MKIGLKLPERLEDAEVDKIAEQEFVLQLNYANGLNRRVTQKLGDLILDAVRSWKQQGFFEHDDMFVVYKPDYGVRASEPAQPSSPAQDEGSSGGGKRGRPAEFEDEQVQAPARKPREEMFPTPSEVLGVRIPLNARFGSFPQFFKPRTVTRVNIMSTNTMLNLDFWLNWGTQPLPINIINSEESVEEPYGEDEISALDLELARTPRGEIVILRSSPTVTRLFERGRIIFQGGQVQADGTITGMVYSTSKPDPIRGREPMTDPYRTGPDLPHGDPSDGPDVHSVHGWLTRLQIAPRDEPLELSFVPPPPPPSPITDLVNAIVQGNQQAFDNTLNYIRGLQNPRRSMERVLQSYHNRLSPLQATVRYQRLAMFRTLMNEGAHPYWATSHDVHNSVLDDVLNMIINHEMGDAQDVDVDDVMNPMFDAMIEKLSTMDNPFDWGLSSGLGLAADVHISTEEGESSYFTKILNMARNIDQIQGVGNLVDTIINNWKTFGSDDMMDALYSIGLNPFDYNYGDPPDDSWFLRYVEYEEMEEEFDTDLFAKIWFFERKSEIMKARKAVSDAIQIKNMEMLRQAMDSPHTKFGRLGDLNPLELAVAENWDEGVRHLMEAHADLRLWEKPVSERRPMLAFVNQGQLAIDTARSSVLLWTLVLGRRNMFLYMVMQIGPLNLDQVTINRARDYLIDKNDAANLEAFFELVLTMNNLELRNNTANSYLALQAFREGREAVGRVLDKWAVWSPVDLMNDLVWGRLNNMDPEVSASRLRAVLFAGADEQPEIRNLDQRFTFVEGAEENDTFLLIEFVSEPIEVTAWALPILLEAGKQTYMDGDAVEVRLELFGVQSGINSDRDEEDWYEDAFSRAVRLVNIPGIRLLLAQSRVKSYLENFRLSDRHPLITLLTRFKKDRGQREEAVRAILQLVPDINLEQRDNGFVRVRGDQFKGKKFNVLTIAALYGFDGLARDLVNIYGAVVRDIDIEMAGEGMTNEGSGYALDQQGLKDFLRQAQANQTEEQRANAKRNAATWKMQDDTWRVREARKIVQESEFTGEELDDMHGEDVLRFFALEVLEFFEDGPGRGPFWVMSRYIPDFKKMSGVLERHQDVFARPFSPNPEQDYWKQYPPWVALEKGRADVLEWLEQRGLPLVALFNIGYPQGPDPIDRVAHGENAQTTVLGRAKMGGNETLIRRATTVMLVVLLHPERGYWRDLVRNWTFFHPELKTATAPQMNNKTLLGHFISSDSVSTHSIVTLLEDIGVDPNMASVDPSEPTSGELAVMNKQYDVLWRLLRFRGFKVSQGMLNEVKADADAPANLYERLLEHKNKFN